MSFDDPDIANVSAAGHALYGLQLAVGGILLAAAVLKARQPRAFAQALAEYVVVAARLAPPLAFAIVALELLCGLSLVTGRFLGASLALSATMFVAFFAAVALQLQRGERIGCGCFGATNDAISPRTLARLALLFGATSAVALAVFALDVSVADPAAIIDRGVDSAAYFGTLGAFAAGLVLAGAWVLHADRLKALLFEAAGSDARPRPASPGA